MTLAAGGAAWGIWRAVRAMRSGATGNDGPALASTRPESAPER